MTATRFKLNETMASDALLLGRVTYEGFAEAWPQRDDPAGFAKKFNSMPKYVVSAQLAQWLLENDLVDEVRLMVHPVVLGTGKRVFGELSEKKPLKLADSKAVGPDGVFILTYQPVGD